MDNRILLRLFRSLLPIQALALGLTAMNNLFTTFIVGNFIPGTGLAAIGFANPLALCLTTLGTLLSVGSQLICGRCLGEGNAEGIKRTFNSTLACCVAVGAVITLLCVAFPYSLARLLGASGDCYDTTAQFVRGFGSGAIFNLLAVCMLPFLQLDQKANRATACVAAMVAVNIGFNFLNAFILKWGLFGAGLATALANLVLVLVALPHFLFKSKVFRFSPSSIGRESIAEVLRQGAPAGLKPIGLAVKVRMINGFLFAMGGTLAMSAMSVACTLSDAIGCMIEGGYTNTGRMIGSVLVGERDTSSLHKLPRIMIRAIAPVYTGTYLLLCVFAKPIALLMGAELADVAVYVTFIRLYLLWFITNIFQTPAFCQLQALGRGRSVAIMNLLNALIFPAMLCLPFGKLLGIEFIVSISWIAEIMDMIAFTVYFIIKAKRFPKLPFEMAYVPSRFMVERENRFKATVTGLEDLSNASQGAIDFCKGRGIDSRTAYFCGLCIEEMAAYTVEHGFPQSKHKSCSIDLRIVYDEGELTVMLRDDCPYFNPTKWLALYTPDDKLSGIGIKMVSELAKEMNHTSTLGLNVVTIKL